MGSIKQINVGGSKSATAGSVPKSHTNAAGDLVFDPVVITKKRTIGSAFDAAYGMGNNKYPQRLSKHHRSPWIVSCVTWLWKGKYIPFFINPSDVQWSMPRRGSVQKTAAGAVRNTWRNRYRKTYFDEAMLNITFQAGNIMPSSAYVNNSMTTYDEIQTARANPKIPPGLDNFYSFLELLDTHKLSGVTENRHIIIMHTRVFPVLRLEGFFTEEPITFSESGQEGNTLKWTASFQVYKTYPRITNANQMRQVYAEFVRDRAWGETVSPMQVRDSVFHESVGEGGAGIPVSSSTSSGGKGASPLDTAGAIQTVGSAARGRDPVYSGEISENDLAHNFIIGH